MKNEENSSSWNLDDRPGYLTRPPAVSSIFDPPPGATYSLQNFTSFFHFQLLLSGGFIGIS